MHTEKFAKFLHKVEWNVLSTLGRSVKPRIEVLYDCDVDEGPGEHEFVHRCLELAYIEPVYGYLITDRNQLVEESLVPNAKFWRKPWRLGTPSPADYFRARDFSSRPVLRYPCVISLRHWWEWNYYHFYIDVLGKLNLLDEIGIDRSIPLLVGKYVHEKPFARQLINRGLFRDRKWVIADDNYVLADEVIYCRTKQTFKKRLDYILDQIDAPGPFSDVNDRVFLTRGRTASRHILNIEAVEAVMEKHRFRFVDTAEMDLAEQIDLFSKTRFLVGIHGAGLINMIFRRSAPMSILELQPNNSTADCFQTIAQAYGYSWDSMAGTPDASHYQYSNFTVSIEQLEEKVDRMLHREVILSHTS